MKYSRTTKIDSLLHWSFLFICFGLYLYQISKICEIYFSYKTTISMSFENISEISLPAVSLCVEKSFLLKSQHFIQLSLNQSDRSPQTIQKIRRFINSKTIRGQMEVMYSKEYVFRKSSSESCAVLRPKGISSEKVDDFVDCEEVSPIITSMDIYSMCFTFFSQLEEQQEDRYVIDYSVQKFQDFTDELIYIKLNQNITSIRMYFHSRKERLQKFFIKNTGIDLKFENGITPYVRYKKMITRSLTKPYETNCHQKEGFNTNNDCISQCRIRNWVEILSGKWPSLYFTSNFSDMEILDLYQDFYNISERTIKDKSIGNICRKECGSFIDCVSESYEVNMDKLQFFSENTWMAIQPPTTPDQVIQHSPKIIFEEFISFIASLSGFYFGFSIVMLSDVTSLTLKYLFNFIVIRKNYIFKTNNLHILSGNRSDIKKMRSKCTW